MEESYLFAGRHLFLKNGDYCPVTPEPEPMTLRCVNIQCSGNNNFMGASTWEFQIVGRGDTWYRTHYDYALVQETQRNRQLHDEFEAWHRKKDECQRQASKCFKQIVTFSRNHPHVDNDN